MPVFSPCVTVRPVCRFPCLLLRGSSEYDICMALPGDSERGPQHEAQRKSGENRRSHRQDVLPFCIFRKSSAGSRDAAQQRGQKYQEKDGFNAEKSTAGSDQFDISHAGSLPLQREEREQRRCEHGEKTGDSSGEMGEKGGQKAGALKSAQHIFFRKRAKQSRRRDKETDLIGDDEKEDIALRRGGEGDETDDGYRTFRRGGQTCGKGAENKQTGGGRAEEKCFVYRVIGILSFRPSFHPFFPVLFSGDGFPDVSDIPDAPDGIRQKRPGTPSHTRNVDSAYVFLHLTEPDGRHAVIQPRRDYSRADT